MTLLCAHCGSPSRVVLSRRIVNVSWVRRAHPRRVENVVRTRQCINCRWKWKTIERILHAKAKKEKAPAPAPGEREQLSVPAVRRVVARAPNIVRSTSEEVPPGSRGA